MPRRRALAETSRPRRLASWLAWPLLAAGCSQPPTIPTAGDVDLERFMGPWYVIANIPTFIERGAHNAVETYARDPDGTIATTFSFRRDAFDGKLVEHHPRGFVSEESTSIWGMQFIWPIKAEYVIAHVAPDYSQTIVARSARDYVWIMARTPTLSDEDYARLVALVAELGYDTAKLERVPQQW